jgi:hypothetical protein
MSNPPLARELRLAGAGRAYQLQTEIPARQQAEASMGTRHSGQSERWFFYQDAKSLWKWARLDVFGIVLAYSDGAFPAREQCVQDARRCGYREVPVPVEDLGSVGAEARTSSVYTQSTRF